MKRAMILLSLLAAVTASCGGDAEGGIVTTAAPTTVASPTTVLPASTTQQSTTTTLTTTTTTVTPTTTTTTVASTTTTSTAVAETTTTTVAASGPECADCPDWATEQDVEYVASMRDIETRTGQQSYVTSMTAFEIIDMGQTICFGLDGSYAGSFDNAFAAQLLIYSPAPSDVGVAVSSMEQAARIFCPQYTSAWKAWAGTDPYDPFE